MSALPCIISTARVERGRGFLGVGAHLEESAELGHPGSIGLERDDHNGKAAHRVRTRLQAPLEPQHELQHQGLAVLFGLRDPVEPLGGSSRPSRCPQGRVELPGALPVGVWVELIGPSAVIRPLPPVLLVPVARGGGGGGGGDSLRRLRRTKTNDQRPSSSRALMDGFF